MPEAAPVNIVIAWAKENTKILISIKHEANGFTAREVMLAAGLSPSRERYRLRDGYVIEVAEGLDVRRPRLFVPVAAIPFQREGV